MPNWCFTGIDISGKKEDAAYLYEKIKEWTSKNHMKNDFGNNWLGNVVLGSGVATKESFESSDTPRCRGKIIYSDIYSVDEETTAMHIDTETAWCPMVRMWLMIIEQYKLDLEIVYYSEEPGMGEYLTNDPSLLGTYIIDAWGIDEVSSCYGVTEQYVISVLQELLKTSDHNIDRLLSMFNASEYSKEMSIHKYEFVEIENCG